MEWFSMYNQETEPTLSQISEFIDNSLWQDINSFLQDNYGIEPKIEYSVCSAQRGWNIKYKKNGKSLCTLYPMEGYFIALVVVGKKELTEAEFLLVICSEYTQNLYKNTSLYNGSKWLMMNITDEKILDDMKELIKIRVKPKEKL